MPTVAPGCGLSITRPARRVPAPPAVAGGAGRLLATGVACGAAGGSSFGGTGPLSVREVSWRGAGRSSFEPYEGPIENTRIVFIGEGLTAAEVEPGWQTCLVAAARALAA